MRTATLDLEGRHILCLSLRAVHEITAKYGGLPALFQALTDPDTEKRTESLIWTLGILMDAGDRYAKLNSLENAPVPGELMDLIGPYDLSAVRNAVFAAISNGQSGTIQTKEVKGKNAKAAPAGL